MTQKAGLRLRRRLTGDRIDDKRPDPGRALEVKGISLTVKLAAEFSHSIFVDAAV